MKNAEYLNRLCKIECPDSTCWSMIPPLVLSGGKGSEVFDVEGAAYIDLISGFGSACFGHGFPIIASTNEEHPPLVQGMGDLYPSLDKLQFLEALVSLLPSHFQTVSLALTGSQAVETAIKTAILHTGCSGFINLSGGYHGLDLGALELTDNQKFKDPFQAFLNLKRVRTLPRHCPPKDILRLIKELNSSHYGFAGIIVEPIQGRSGVLQLDPAWLQQIIDIVKEERGLVIFDEIFSGCGRTGSFLASDLQSDILLLGKALGGGYPLSACISSQEIMAAWPKCNSEALHTGTFFGSPISCRAGLGVIKNMCEPGFHAMVKAKGERAKELLNTGLKQSDNVVEIRAYGLFIGIQLKHANQAALLTDRLRENYVLALPSGARGEVLSIIPAYNIPIELLEKAVDTIVKCIMALS